MLSCSYSTISSQINHIKVTEPSFYPFQGSLRWGCRGFQFGQGFAVTNTEEPGKTQVKVEKPRFKWIEIGPNITEEQKQAISQLPPKMTKRCKAILKHVICLCPEKGNLSDLLAAWVRSMKPRRADWLAVLKELKIMEHPLYIQVFSVSVSEFAIKFTDIDISDNDVSGHGYVIPVAELALLEESFEANIRDYTKIIHSYGKLNHVEGAENTLVAMKRRGFICDQVTLTAMVDMYSKADNLKLAEETFEEIKLLGQPPDKRSYGSMIMAYIRAGMPERGEVLLREMDAREIYAGSEVYKALLRVYSMNGDSKGAQRVFDAIQFAGISPDARFCALLINAYRVAGESQKAYIAFENMRKAGLEPSDKCVALVLAAFEKENKLNKALDFLVDLERKGTLVGKEASAILAGWFKRLGVVEEVESVLREYATREFYCKIHVSS
ncbi:hypothetical protein JRO89_XS01G0300700 [Xanthoceras sorbifolium]|uniref:PROP1-like PPR domain-containing protein n=1 Tax=Xanthoceras sorbifolium TaxID=99658 RepID=A0ABQ8IMH2_9ROSI|nr:hypothetical protein JRO89_XS01G0300700 [Xanthoceras sorbifolium]